MIFVDKSSLIIIFAIILMTLDVFAHENKKVHKEKKEIKIMFMIKLTK